MTPEQGQYVQNISYPDVIFRLNHCVSHTGGLGGRLVPDTRNQRITKPNSRKSANTKLKTFTSIHKGGHPRRAQSALASMECDCKNTTNYLQVKNQEEKMNRSVPGRRDRCSLHTSVHRSSHTNPAQESVQSRPRPTVKVSVHLDAKRCIL